MSNMKKKSDPGSTMTFGVSDLHLLMALVQVNEGSRDVSPFSERRTIIYCNISLSFVGESYFVQVRRKINFVKM